MKYMGSKNRIAKHILPIILKDRRHNQWYVEPFVGGANMIDKVDGDRVGADSNYYLIECLKRAEKGWIFPDFISEDLYNHIKKNSDDYEPWLVGYVGFSMSFGGKWFGGYRRDVAGSKGCKKNMETQSRRSFNSINKQSKLLRGVRFVHVEYNKLEIPPKSLVYCDPPYANTTKYKTPFNHAAFWQWCREQTANEHRVFISEYNAPSDFGCVWSGELNSSLTKNTGAKRGTEKLFILNDF